MQSSGSLFFYVPEMQFSIRPVLLWHSQRWTAIHLYPLTQTHTRGSNISLPPATFAFLLNECIWFIGRGLKHLGKWGGWMETTFPRGRVFWPCQQQAFQRCCWISKTSRWKRERERKEAKWIRCTETFIWSLNFQKDKMIFYWNKFWAMTSFSSSAMIHPFRASMLSSQTNKMSHFLCKIGGGKAIPK